LIFWADQRIRPLILADRRIYIPLFTPLMYSRDRASPWAGQSKLLVSDQGLNQSIDWKTLLLRFKPKNNFKKMLIARQKET